MARWPRLALDHPKSEISRRNRGCNDFLGMRLSEKRACLRASGIKSMPRPREGPRMVDAIMIPLLDEEVAYEVLRRLGETKGTLLPQRV